MGSKRLPLHLAHLLGSMLRNADPRSFVGPFRLWTWASTQPHGDILQVGALLN